MSNKKLPKNYFKAFNTCHEVANEALNELPELLVKSHFSTFLPGDNCTLFCGEVEYLKVSAKQPCLVCVVTFDL